MSLVGRNLSNTEVVITSPNRGVMSALSKMKAAHKTVNGLSAAVEGARLVILDAAVGEMREMMETIGPYIEPDTVVTDTVNIKGPVMRWAEEYLPKDASFIGGHPLLKSPPESIEDADPRVFDGARYTIVPSKSADEQAVRTVTGLVEALGAIPIFLDSSEHDSYAAAMHHLPIIMSSAYVMTTASSSGWREMHRLAESQFDTFGRHAANDPLDNEAVCLADPDALVHWIDQLILELYSFRNEISDENDADALLDRFVKAWELRSNWEADAVVPKEGTKLPTAGESMMSAMFGDKLANRLRVMRDKEKQPDSGGNRFFRRNR